ncbi:hypothetical protein BH09SUM1_BH09SUM1_06410 [soil metagenome]
MTLIPPALINRLMPSFLRKTSPAAALSAVLLFVACGGQKAAFDTPYGQSSGGQLRQAARTETREELQNVLDSRTGQHETLWMKSGVVVRDPAAKEKNFFTALVVYKAPSAIRLRGTRNPVGGLFDILIDDQAAFLYFNREGTAYNGTLDELSEKASIVGGFTPRDLVTAVFVEQELRDLLDSGEQVSVTDKGEKLLFGSTHSTTGKQMFWFVRKDDQLVEELLIRDEIGVPELRIHYYAYQFEDIPDAAAPEPFPKKFKLTFEKQKISATVDVDQYKWDVKLGPEAWKPPTARRTYPLSALEFEERAP